MRKTSARLWALLHADGDDVPQPTYGVARPLEQAGLIRWAIRSHPLERIWDSLTLSRGWFLTSAGAAVLAEWLAAEPDELAAYLARRDARAAELAHQAEMEWRRSARR